MIRACRSWTCAIVATFVLLGGTSRAVADDVPVIGTKTSISVSTASGKAKVTSVQKSPGIHYGTGGVNPALLDATFEAYYVDTPANRSTLPLPAPWLTNTGVTARFKNNLAPAGSTAVKAGLVK